MPVSQPSNNWRRASSGQWTIWAESWGELEVMKV
jgi:hypothetical protein